MAERREPRGSRAARFVAVGDPQAPYARYMQVLKRRGITGARGELAPGVRLVSMGDHFDWGDRDDRARAGRDGVKILSWLAAQPDDRVTILAGNHDLSRVGELAHFDDRTFRAAQREADAARAGRPVRPEHEFRRAWNVPSWELVARDLGTFREAQRALVVRLLRARRLRAAVAATPRVLLVHAGITVDDLDILGVPRAARADARVVARALNAAFDRAVRGWRPGRAMVIPGIHHPGTWRGEGGSIFYQRASITAPPRQKPPRRRFRPERLPPGLVQVIGHIRDKKSRDLFGLEVTRRSSWRDGPLRHAVVRRNRVHYAYGLPEPRSLDERDAVLVYTDGGMNHCDPPAYEVLEILALGDVWRR